VTDIRTRLADALTDAIWSECERQIPCGDPFPEAEHIDVFIRYRDEGDEYEQRLSVRDVAHALLSLPGMAIVELPEISVNPDYQKQWKTPAEIRQYAAVLLAAANAAEVPSAAAGDGPWPGDGVLGAWR
jgi:hypothetical protein